MTAAAPPELAALRARLAELHHLGSVAAILAWDQHVCMPRAGAAARADALATLERISHERQVDPEIGRLLAALEGYARDLDPDSVDARLLARARRDHEKAVRVSADLAAAMAREAALGEQSWLQARASADFAAVRDSLERQFELRRTYSECFPEAAHPYDVLLDDFEEGATVAMIRPLFDELRDGLRPLVQSGRPPVDDLWKGPFPLPAQRALVRDVLTALGFTDDRFRLDDAAHPFAQSGGPGDHRITTRFRVDDLTWSLHSAMHEFGHGLYEAQIDPALGPGPLRRAVSLGIHESQSRLWENQVGRGLPFCTWLLPRLREHLDGFGAATPEDLFRSLNGVRPSLIRTEADETTYNLHVALRVDLEIAVMEGRLDVPGLPDAWDAGMERLLGVVPESPVDGVLQDIHWPAGLIGYFATYTLGNVVAAQLWNRVLDDVPELEAGFERGDFSALRAWLGAAVHRHGRRYRPAELLRAATGEDLDVRPLLAYLEGRLRAAGSNVRSVP